MSIPARGHKEAEDFIAAQPDPLFESFFDSNSTFNLSVFPEPFGASDSSADSNLFDGLSTASSSTGFALTDFSPSSAFDFVQRPISHSRDVHYSTAPLQNIPRSRKLVHQLRPDGIGISGSELLSLEGQSSPAYLAHHTSNGQPRKSLPSTPPITPNPQRIRPRTSTSPIRKQSHTTRPNSHSHKMITHKSSHADLRLSKSHAMLQNTGRSDDAKVYQDNKPTLSAPASTRFPPHNYGASFTAEGTATSLVTRSSAPALRDRVDHNYGVPQSNAYPPSQEDRTSGPSLSWLETRSFSGSTYPSTCTAWEPSPVSPLENAVLFNQLNFGIGNSSHNYPQLDSSMSSSGLLIQYGNDACDPGLNSYHANAAPLTTSFDSFSSTGLPSSGPSPLHSPGLPPDTNARPESAPSNSSVREHPNPGTAMTPPAASMTLPHRPALQQQRSRRTLKHASHGITKSTTNLKSGSSNKLSSKSFDNSHNSGDSHGSSAPTASTTSMGFVNFTPSDSRKILTGVAPSGSSKTKARREREAVERQRRLSEAAAKLVREAGGDLEKLRRHGVLEESSK